MRSIYTVRKTAPGILEMVVENHTKKLPLLSRPRIEATFNAKNEPIFSRSEISRIINENKEHWLVGEVSADDTSAGISDPSVVAANSLNVTDMLEMLVASTELSAVKLAFPYRALQRYTWGEVPAYQLLQSIDENAYFSHFTAMHLQGLTEQIPKTVYINVEQRAAGGGGVLTQDGIDRAFKGRCRVSKNMITFRGQTVCKLNGKNTGQLGVIRFTMDEGYDVRVTNTERTLIDGVVRPVYAGGVGEVAKAFRAAADVVSVNKLAAYLRKLNFTYPYHQAIGYYLERAGMYRDSQVKLMEQFPIEFDFYLTYDMKNPEYNTRWRLFTPKGF